MRFALVIIGLLAGFASFGKPLSAQPEDRLKVEKDRVTAFLHKSFPGKSWDKGPLPIDTDAVRQAYPTTHFYYVFSPWPRSGYEGKGAKMTAAEAEKYHQRVAKHIKEKLSIVVAVGPKDSVYACRKEEDFNRGLIKIGDDAAARCATAAILSLRLDLVGGLASWNARDIIITRDKNGVKGRTPPDRLTIIWGVNFDAAGKCQSAGMFSPPPPPPP